MRTAQRNSWLAIVAALAFVTYLPNVSAQLILDVVETGGDNEPTDTITAKWTGQTWTVTVDNRLSDGDNLTPPTFGPTSMQWILDQGWTATANGINRFSDPLFPDEVPIDELADGTIQQYFSVYEKEFGAGTLDLFQADNAGRNMYGVVFQLIPEPSTWALLGLGLGALALARRRAR
jgi:hypothetical protein